MLIEPLYNAEIEAKASNYDPTNLFKADVSRHANSFTAARTTSPSFTASSLLDAYSIKYVPFELVVMLKYRI